MFFFRARFQPIDFINKVLFLLCILFLGCHTQDRVSIDAEIKRGKEIIKKRAHFYAHICYRENASLEKGASFEERRVYDKELLAEIEKKSQTDYSDSDLARLKKELEEKSLIYTPEAILGCAKRNFSYLSPIEKKWFEIFNDYGIEQENFVWGIAPFREDLLESQLIMVGNNHAFGVEQSQILYDLTNYLHANRREVGGFLLESANNGIMERNLEALRRSSQGLVFQNHFEKNLWADVRADQFLKTYIGQSSFSELFYKSRVKTFFRYALEYPHIPMMSIDERTTKDPLLRARDTGIDLVALQNLMNVLHPSQSLLAFYGEAHAVRMGDNDTTRIEKEVKYQERKIKTFVISQGAGFLNALLRLVLDLKMKDDLLDFVTGEFSFPKSSSLFQATLSRDFYDVW
ncbi:MAG: hypothetical protein HYY62_07160, partial [Deltaproteobacteria bacterium]|nr:hypothetical protein [Deltaproteobacteria bacterium]